MRKAHPTIKIYAKPPVSARQSSARPTTKSVIIFTCKVCRLPQELKGMASRGVCEYCRPIKTCAHGVKVTESCNECWKIHHNYFLRVF